MIEFFVFCFGWMHLLIEFNVEDGETIPKEGATWQITSHLMIESFVFCFAWMHLLIDFNVEDRKTIPKEGSTW